jgi:hypothetical protein
MGVVRAALAAVILALFPSAVLAHGGTEVSVGGEIRPNGSIDVTGEEFAPNDVVRIELRKEGVNPIELGRVPADDEGAFSATLHVPATVRPGLYRLAAEGKESATADVPVLEPAEGPVDIEPAPLAGGSVSNDRPAGEVVGLAALTAAIALVAVGLLWLSRTHPKGAGA